MADYYHICPKCKEEILFEVYAESADDFEGYDAGMCAPEYQKDCKCEFTDSEIEKLEETVANNYAESVYNYEP